MARLPGAEALGERPSPVLPRRTPLVADYRATSGFEEASAQVLGHSAAELERASGIAVQAQEQQDALRAEDAFNQLRAKQIDMTFGKDGFANLKGGNAVNRPLLKEYGSEFDGAAAQLAGGLDNDYQRQLFTKRSQVAGMQMREDIARHVSHQSDVYADTVFKSSMDVNAKAAGARWSAPDAAVEPLLHMDNVIKRQAERLGTGQEWVEEMQAKAKSSVYTSMVKAALASDPLKGPFAAESILKLHGKEIDPATHFVLAHEVKAAIRPIEVGAIAQDSVNEVLTGVVSAMAVGGEQATNRVVADTAEPVDFRYRLPNGKVEEGTARNAAVAEEYGKRVLGIESGKVGATNVDVNALVGDAIAKAEAKAQAMKPGDTQFRDEVVAKTKNYISTIAAAKESGQVAAVNGLVGIINPVDGKGPQTKEELLRNPQARGMYLALTPKQQLGIDEALHANVKRVLGETGTDKTEVLFDLARRTQLPVGDPNRIRTDAQLVEYLAPGKGLTMAGYNFVRALAEKTNSIDGQSEAKYMHHVMQRGAQMMADSMQGQLLIMSSQKDKLDAAQNNFAFDAMKKIDQYKKDGKPLDPLFDPNSPEYLNRPEILAKYLPPAKATVADQAEDARKSQGVLGGPAAVRQPEPAIAPQYDVGKTYTFKQGKFKYKGGDPAQASSFEAVK